MKWQRNFLGSDFELSQPIIAVSMAGRGIYAVMSKISPTMILYWRISDIHFLQFNAYYG